MKVLIQAGHSSDYPPFAPSGGGAPGEAAWTAELGRRLMDRLNAYGVDVVLVGHWYGYAPPAQAYNQTYDLALFLHYDAAIYASNTGAFADRYRQLGLRATRPGAPKVTVAPDDQTIGGHFQLARSRGVPLPMRAGEPGNANADREEAFIATWNDVYAKRTGIPITEQRRNANTYQYYGYAATLDGTPGILIEHGVGQGLDHAELFDHLDDVADAETAAIVQWLGISTDPTPEPSPEPPPDPAPEDDMTPEQHAIFDTLAERDLTTVQSIRDLYVWGDETANQIEAVRGELAHVRTRGAEIGTALKAIKRLPKLAKPLADELVHFAT